MNLEINRDMWLRGEGSGGSFLLRWDDRKRCCVGIYLKALRVKDTTLRNREAACSLAKVPQAAEWLLGKPVEKDCSRDNSADAGDLYAVNDDPDLVTAEEREAEVARIFAKHGVNVTFTGGQQ